MIDMIEKIRTRTAKQKNEIENKTWKIVETINIKL